MLKRVSLWAQMLHSYFLCLVRAGLMTPGPISFHRGPLWIQGPGDPFGELMGPSQGPHLVQPGSEYSATRPWRGIFSFSS